MEPQILVYTKIGHSDLAIQPKSALLWSSMVDFYSSEALDSKIGDRPGFDLCFCKNFVENSTRKLKISHQTPTIFVH